MKLNNMFEEIKKEIKKTCNSCNVEEKKCNNIDCLAYKIKNIITYNTTIKTLNIDDFFEEEKNKQQSLFDSEHKT